MWLLLVAALLIDHRDIAVVADTVDLIEINHYYDQRGKLVLEQVIFWEWSDERCAFSVVAWKLLKSPHQRPRRNYKQGGYTTTWLDRTNRGKTLRRVRAKYTRETWTLHDPEVQDREFLPKQLRRGLSRGGY